MLDPGSNKELPPIPAKRYFTIGEVSELCDVKPHVLRYWETEFPSLKPVKRRGNRRYYQRHDVLMVRQIRGLLYEQGYTIGGARLRLDGEGAKQESALSSQIVKQVRMELEEVLQLLRRKASRNGLHLSGRAAARSISRWTGCPAAARRGYNPHPIGV